MRKFKFYTGEYYHIYNRGVDKRDIFLSDADYFRFLKEMRYMNCSNRVSNFKNKHCIEAKPRYKGNEGDALVGIICYCLMPNHFHFMLRQLKDDSISKFMQKVGTGYTQYFNLKYNRSGSLFQGTFKAKHITEDAYLLHLSRYIHRNPLEISKVNNFENHLKPEEYKWSSFSFYLEQARWCLVRLTKEIVTDQFSNIEEYRKFVYNHSEQLPEDFKRFLIEEECIEV